MLHKFCPKNNSPVKFAELHGGYFEPCYKSERKQGDVVSHTVCDNMISDKGGVWCSLIDKEERLINDWIERDGRVYRISVDKSGALHQTEV